MTVKEPPLGTSPPVNWGHLLDQIQTDYESHPAKGVAHGLQKEAIQNGWGARSNRKTGAGWGFAFELLGLRVGLRVMTMTDRGAIGLIGDTDFDWSKLGGSDAIPDDQRLARFESAYESGGEGDSPGLFGRGKLIFNIASKQHLIYYDSLTQDGNYRLGKRRIQGRKYEQYERVLEGADAEAKLAEVSGGLLKRLTEPGTRITVIEPVDEVVEAVTSGAFMAAIEETWWEIIRKFGACITVTVPPAPPATAMVPAPFDGLPEKSRDGWSVYYRDNIGIDGDGTRHIIKRVHLLVAPSGSTLPSDLLGVVLHRRGMAIGPMKLSGLPSDLQDRFFGYVELDPRLEEALVEAKQENTTHYGFAYVRRAPYTTIRQVVQTHFEEFLSRLGYTKPGTSPEEQLKRLAEDARSELNTILNSLGVPGFGGGRSDATLVLTVEDLAFPTGSNEVNRGDSIGPLKFRLENFGRTEEEICWSVKTHSREYGDIEELQPLRSEKLQANGSITTSGLTINLDARYPSPAKVGCTCEVTDKDGKKLCRRTFFLYVGLTRTTAAEIAKIHLAMADWPRSNSRRVDFGEKIRNLLYEVENTTAFELKLRLRLRTLWAREGNLEIEEIGSPRDVILAPFQVKALTIPEVNVTEETYQEVGRGKVNLRMHAIALEDGPDWEKSDRVDSTVPFYLNMDPLYGFFDDIDYNRDGKAAPRSEARPSDEGRSWRLSINLTHPACLEAEGKDEQRRRDYLFEEMARQSVYVLLRTGQLDSLAKQIELEKDEDIAEMPPDDIVKRVEFAVTDRILASYYGG